LPSGTARTARSATAFLRSLKARGLGGVQLVISDAHTGLKQAINAVFIGAAWQRCRVH
jgi:putative transposase